MNKVYTTLLLLCLIANLVFANTKDTKESEYLPTAMLAITGTVTPLLCNASNGAASGIIDITVSGGTAPYSYNWIGPYGFSSTTEDISNLPSGTYTLTVRDAMGASAVESWILDEPSSIDIIAALHHSDCNSSNGPLNGRIDVIVTGGIAPYTYAWTGPGVQPFSASQSELGTGTFTLEVTDANGCSFSDAYDLTVPTPIVISEVLNQPDCNYENGALSGDIDITISGGLSPYTYAWTGPDIMTQATHDDITGLGGGDYSVTVTDAHGCEETATYTLTEPAPIVLEVLALQDEGCGTLGSVAVSASGAWSPYTYQWSNGAIGQEIEDLYAGLYSVTVSDSNACTSEESYVISESGIKLDYEILDDDCSDIKIKLNISGGTAPYVSTYTTTGGALGEASQVLEEDAGSITYTAAQKDESYVFDVTDAIGCISSVAVSIGLAPLLSEPHLCMVTSDEDGYNRILWEDPIDAVGITHYDVYRNKTGINELVGSTSFEDFNELTDKSVDPNVQAYTYVVQARDACDNKSPISNEHKTIHLVMGQGLNGNINLSWGTYVGQPYDQVIVYRGTTPDNLEVLTTVSASSFSYTDLNPPVGNLYYQLEIVGEFNCNTGRSLFSLKSNIIDNLEISSLETITDFDGSIYPNPVQDQVMITLKEDMQMRVRSLNGQLFLSQNLKQGTNQVSTSRLQSGVYCIELTSGAKRYTQRIVKMK